MQINWSYLRKGWTSTKKAQEFLEQKNVSSEAVTWANKQKYGPDDAWEILKKAKTISIAKGKKVRTFDPHSDDKDDILKHALGTSGTLRAPAYIDGGRVVIGFNPELYDEWVS